LTSRAASQMQKATNATPKMATATTMSDILTGVDLGQKIECRVSRSVATDRIIRENA
jgi:hypothetical protein